MKNSWPGKITFRLKRKKCKFKLYGIDKNTIALRIPKTNFLNILLKRLNFPLVQTSVNISGRPPINNIEEALKLFNKKKNKPDLIIDGGILKNKQSKLIDITVFPPKILRP